MPAITSLPFVGSGWGNYWLESSLQYSSLTGAAITLPHYSSLDWRGNQIYGPYNKAAQNIGVLIQGQETVQIYGHGGPSQFAVGLSDHPSATGVVGSGHRIRDTIVRLCWHRGFFLHAHGLTIDNCMAVKIGGTTFYTSSHVFGYEFLGDGIIARRNVASDVSAPEGTEACGFATNNHVKPGVFEDNIAVNPEVREMSIGFFFGSDFSRIVAVRNTAVNQATGYWWKEPNATDPGTPGAYRDNIAHNCTTKYVLGELIVEDLGNNS